MNRPNRKLYIGLLFAAAIISGASFLILQDSRWFAIMTGIGCGGISSVLVAWLIDAANCKQRNKENVQKQKLIFSNYCETVDRLQEFVALKGKFFVGKREALSFSDWLSVMVEIPNNRISNKDAAREKIYRTILNRVSSVKDAIVLLQKQYALLVGLDIERPEKLKEHLDHQYASCEAVADSFIFGTYERVDCETANEALADLIETYRSYFAECRIPEIYNFEMVK